jgi:small ligand-binding sensory domain FIST
VTEDRETGAACRLLAYKLDQHPGDAARRSAVVFLKAQGFEPRHITPLQRIRIAPRLFGAGTVGGRLLAVDAAGRILLGTAAGLLVEGIAPPIIRSSSACRLLGTPKPITRHSGNTVLEIDGEPALEALSEAGVGLRHEPLILVAIVPGGQDSTTAPVIRALHGVDPVRGGLVLSDQVAEGSSIAFAAREARAARANTEGMLRDVAHSSRGAAPRFGIYINCAGRGAALHGSPDVDTRMIRSRFGDMPLAGLQSAFEIAPMNDCPSVQLYTGTLAVFVMPS